MREDYFDVPVVLFLFKRSDTVLKIIDRIRSVKPQKIYLIGDGPRNVEEENIILKSRKIIEKAIDWDCSIIRNYADSNRGVYENIAGGAKWVFEREKYAIFLEDDNLPEVSFFSYCRELLLRYENNKEILWICGTNYLEKFETPNKESYMFTRHLLPCGWASWGSKFIKLYDANLKCLEDPNFKAILRKTYYNKALYKQQLNSAFYEVYRRNNGIKYASWDFQMSMSIRYNGVYGISPNRNLIENIGVDELSIHGGNSLSNEMTRRFCSIKSYPLEFPLIHPTSIKVNENYERKIEKIILFPLKMRIKISFASILKHILGLSTYDKLTINNIRNKRKNR